MEQSIFKKEFIFLIQTKNKNLERLLSNSVQDKNIRLESVERSEDLKEQQPNGKIITFIIGSDVEDPVQSAQRLHTFKKSATIILLSKSEENAETLKEAIKFSPFIGTDVFCLDESKEAELEIRLKKILQDSLKAEKYNAIIAESNLQISSSVASQKPAFNQNFINRLMDIAPIGIAIVGKQKKVLGWNKEATSIFNKNEAQVLRTSLSQLFDQLEGKKLEDYLSQSFEKGKTGPIDPLSLERKSQDTSNQVLSFTAAPFTYSEGTGEALILAIKDETEREQAKRELLEMNETLEERVEERTVSLLSYQDQLRSLASQLSKAEEQERHRLAAELHDNLGQMLAVNKMKMESLQKDQLPDEVATRIEEIKQGMDDALVYTHDLMSDLKPPPSLDKEDVRATIEWLAKKMKKHDLEVIVDDDKQPKRTSEEIRTILLQCVRELLFNIIRHTEEHEAFISMSRLDNHMQIIVKDKGKGMDPDINTSTSTKKGGFGLFNIKERMDLLGGSMEIDSEPGEGTKVTLVAPLKNGDDINIPAESDAAKSISAAEENNQKIKVMLVDDHQMMRKGLKEIVDAEDDLVVVAEASNGKEAVQLARETSPDIIVMDVNMPGMNGIDATKEIMSTMSDIRVVGLSLHDHQKVVESMRSAGATAYLSKSEAFETLCATIRSEARMVKE